MRPPEFLAAARKPWQFVVLLGIYRAGRNPCNLSRNPCNLCVSLGFYRAGPVLTTMHKNSQNPAGPEPEHRNHAFSRMETRRMRSETLFCLEPGPLLRRFQGPAQKSKIWPFSDKCLIPAVPGPARQSKIWLFSNRTVSPRFWGARPREARSKKTSSLQRVQQRPAQQNSKKSAGCLILPLWQAGPTRCETIVARNLVHAALSP